MATSGNVSVSVTSWDSLKFSWWVNSGDQSTTNNTTHVHWKLELIAGGSGAISSSASKSWSVTVDGAKYSGTNTVGISNNSTKILASGVTTVTHASDGSKSFNFSFSQEFDITFSGTHIGTKSGSGSGTLNTIPRASQPSCVTYPNHTQNVGSFGDTISIHMNRKSSDFTHTVRYAFGSLTGTIATGVTTGTTWTIPLSFMELLPAATSGSGTIYVDTYDGSTKIGTKWCGFTATVPVSVKPTCTVQVLDATNVQDTYGNLVKGLSKLYVKTRGYTAYGSPIASYMVNANGVRYTSDEITTGVLANSGNTTVTATVKDKRGRTSAQAKASFTVLDYNKPNISALAVRRCNEDGTANDIGDFIKVTFSASVTALNNKNTALYKLYYKQSLADTWTEVSLIDITNQYSVSGYEYVFEADGGSSFDVEVTAADRHYSASRATSASTAFMPMHFGTDGKSVGLLKAAERSGAVDIGGDIYTNGHALMGAHGLFDTRDANETPEWYMNTYGRGTVWEFKKLTAIGFTAPASMFAPVETIIPWKDSSGGLPRQVAYENADRWTRIATSATTWGAWQSDALRAYPVGSIYLAYNHTNPATLFGGTWQRIYGAFPWFTGANGKIGETGGERNVTLTINQIPTHNHGGTYTNAGDATKTHAWLASGGSAMAYESVDAGGGQPHNNMPPFIQISAWRRTA